MQLGLPNIRIKHLEINLIAKIKKRLAQNNPGQNNNSLLKKFLGSNF